MGKSPSWARHTTWLLCAGDVWAGYREEEEDSWLPRSLPRQAATRCGGNCEKVRCICYEALKKKKKTFARKKCSFVRRERVTSRQTWKMGGGSSLPNSKGTLIVVRTKGKVHFMHWQEREEEEKRRRRVAVVLVPPQLFLPTSG